MGKIKRFQYYNTPALLVCIIAAPAFFIQSVSNAHVNNNLPLIQKSLNISTVSASWLINIEILISIFTCTITGSLGTKFGVCKVFTVGVILHATMNFLYVIPQVSDSIVAVFALRGMASVGLGLYMPSTQTMANQLTRKGKLNVVVTVMSIMAPVGNVISSMSAGAVA